MSASIINVNNLCKTFFVKRPAQSFGGRLRSLIRPTYQEINAVNNISFDVADNQIVAFIGPNGAGKSTCIKMLTGILMPTSGSISVLGLSPMRDRTCFTKLIGTVFGQKAQLWYHLPPTDTFQVLARIYELDHAVVAKRLSLLIDAFEIGSFLHIPVRKLSLGQRMRCEIVAALLHQPRIIFLDEPTIGLDVIAKQQVRETLMMLHKQEGVSIFLTSHDTGDIEALAARAIIINQGSIIFDGTTTELKNRYVTTKVVQLVLEQTTDTFTFAGGTVIEKGRHNIAIELDASPQAIQRLLSYALENFTVADITISQTPLEEVIAAVYNNTFLLPERTL